VEPSAGSPLTSQRSGSHWYRVALLSSPDALAACTARVVEVVTTARDGSKFPTVELRALYLARGMLQGDEDVAGHQAGNAPWLCTARPTENTAWSPRCWEGCAQVTKRYRRCPKTRASGPDLRLPRRPPAAATPQRIEGNGGSVGWRPLRTCRLCGRS